MPDFDAAVQQAVHRIQPVGQMWALFDAARSIGFKSVGLDLVFGLPRQTPEPFDRTLDQITRLRLDRIALRACTHLLQKFKPQRRILPAGLPTEGARRLMLSRSSSAF